MAEQDKDNIAWPLKADFGGIYDSNDKLVLIPWLKTDKFKEWVVRELNRTFEAESEAANNGG